MEIKTVTSFAGFLVALATWNLPGTAAVNLRPHETPTSSHSVDNPAESASSDLNTRLTRLTAALRAREAQLPESSALPEDGIIAGWANGRGGAWVNTHRGGWGDRSGGGGFANVNPWRNGWGNRGGFLNHNPWRNGGGGWLNRR